MNEVQERNRFTVVLNLYHEQHGENPVGERLAASFNLEINSSSYCRKLIVGEEWFPLDLGWLKPENVGYVLIENREGTGYQPVLPSEDQMLETNRRILHVSSPEDSAGWLIPPRQFISAMPVDASVLQMRSVHGPIKVRTIIYPR